MIVYVYLKERTHQNRSKTQRATRVYMISTILIGVNALIYGFCDSQLLYIIPSMRYLWDLCFVGLAYILILVQIPFKFYLTKEFLFVLYDELKNYGLSSKIEDLR
jgi:hypothetical protein